MKINYAVGSRFLNLVHLFIQEYVIFATHLYNERVFSQIKE